MEDGRISFSHFVTLDVPEDSCYSSEHLDIATDPRKKKSTLNDCIKLGMVDIKHIFTRDS